MRYKVTIHEAARIDIEDAFDWYKMQSDFAAAYLIERIEEAFKHIAETPLVYPKVHGSFRQLALKPFPYVLIYSIRQNEVIAARLWHTSRNPKNKFKEL